MMYAMVNDRTVASAFVSLPCTLTIIQGFFTLSSPFLKNLLNFLMCPCGLVATYYTENFHPVKPLFYNLLNFFYEGLLSLYFQRETSIAHRDWRVKPFLKNLFYRIK